MTTDEALLNLRSCTENMQTAINSSAHAARALQGNLDTATAARQCADLEKMLIDAYKFAATLTTTVEGLHRAEGYESRQP